MPAGDPGGHFADTGGYGSFNQGGGGFQTGGALNGGRGEYGLAGDRSYNSGNVGAYSKSVGGNFGNPLYGNTLPPAAKRVNPITGQTINPNPYTTPPVAPAPGVNILPSTNWPSAYGNPGGPYPSQPLGPGEDSWNNGLGWGGYQNWNNNNNNPSNPLGGYGSSGNPGAGGYAGGFATGGFIPPGMHGMVGEAGRPEMVMAGPGGAQVRPMGPPMTLPPAQQPGMGQMPPMGGGWRGFGPAPGQGQGGFGGLMNAINQRQMMGRR